MRCAILVFCAGIVSAVLIVDVARGLTYSVSIAVLIGALIPLSRLLGRHLRVRFLLVATLLFLAGLVWHLHWASVRLNERLDSKLEGLTLEVEGVVLGLPERTPIAQQFHFKILQSPSGFYPRKVALNYYGDELIVPGQRWRFNVRLNRPHGFANPGGFDYEGWLFQQGISARGYVRASAANELVLLEEGGGYISPAVLIHSLRYTLRERLEKFSGDLPYGGLLIALVLGDRSAISQSNWNLFSATGSNHLFVISGLHIGLVSGFCYFLATLMGKLVRIGTLIPVQKFAALNALLAAFGYALLAGFTLPTQRAFIMIAVLIGGLFWNARYLISFRLLLALLVVLLLNPLAIISSGFWLSFVAVAALLSFAGGAATNAPSEILEPSLSDRGRALFNYFAMPQFIVLIALAIPLIYFTGQLSLLSPLVNIVAIPVVGFLIVPLCFFALLVSFVHSAAASVLLDAAHGSIALLMQFMDALATWGGGSLQLQFSQLGGIKLFAMIFAALLMLLPKGICRRSLIVPLLLPLVPLSESAETSKAAENFLRVNILDVGQGLAVVVQTNGHNLLYDSGANLSPDFNVGSAVIVPALRDWGIEKLDAVVISHGDNDHAGGLSGIREHMEIESLIANDRSIDANNEVTLCESVSDWTWDGVEFRFLTSGLDFPDENNNSCVLQVRFAGVAVLLPGDIEREAEAQLVLRYGVQLASTLLLAPHHGSLSSSSYALLKKVRPDYVVFSAGYHNSFGHPHEKVRARYGEFASRALITSAEGMISFHFDGRELGDEERVEPKLYREQNFRYWR